MSSISNQVSTINSLYGHQPARAYSHIADRIVSSDMVEIFSSLHSQDKLGANSIDLGRNMLDRYLSDRADVDEKRKTLSVLKTLYTQGLFEAEDFARYRQDHKMSAVQVSEVEKKVVGQFAQVFRTKLDVTSIREIVTPSNGSEHLSLTTSSSERSLVEVELKYMGDGKEGLSTEVESQPSQDSVWITTHKFFYGAAGKKTSFQKLNAFLAFDNGYTSTSGKVAGWVGALFLDLLSVATGGVGYGILAFGCYMLDNCQTQESHTEV